MKDLETARKEISAVDKEMAALFIRRMNAAKDVADYKKERGLPVYDREREQALIKRNSAYVDDPVIRSYYLKFLEETMTLSKAYQHHLLEGTKVAYSGIEGAFAQIAASYIFPDGVQISYSGFESAYNSVADGSCDCAVLPIENSYAGEVGQVIDLIFEGDLVINGMYNLRISQNLLGTQEADLSDIKTVISHPQALEQCDEYISKRGLKKIQAENTAEAARMVAEKNDPTLAAIASAETAGLYGLKLIDHDINQSKANTTKFAVLSRTANNTDAGQGTFILMFTVNDEAGALVKAISVIGKYGFNMKVLRSRPVKARSWQYYFYVEAEGDETSENGKKMLEELSKQCERLKIAGHYNTAHTSDDLKSSDNSR